MFSTSEMDLCPLQVESRRMGKGMHVNHAFLFHSFFKMSELALCLNSMQHKVQKELKYAVRGTCELTKILTRG